MCVFIYLTPPSWAGMETLFKLGTVCLKSECSSRLIAVPGLNGPVCPTIS